MADGNGAAPMAVVPADTKDLNDAAIHAAIRLAARRSVIEPEDANLFPSTTGGDIGSVFFVGTAADGITPWGVNPTFRDRQLRLFYPTESVLNSAFSSVVARNMGFDWTLKGPDPLVEATFDLLHSANRGAGWLNFVGKVSTDLYTQDKGAFIEMIRLADRPDSPVIGIQHLDAARCFHTGNPDIPVLYFDRKGKWHRLRWFQVITMTEMPAPHERLYGLQYSALTRVMRAAQIFKNIQTYREEKTGGRNARAIHVVGGVEASRIESALRQFEARNDAAGLERFPAGAPVVTALNPANPPTVATLEFASLPDTFDAEQAFKEYLTVMSLGLFVDFQEFAPLPGGNLGTSAQSQTLHLKTQGKGPALWMKLFEERLNFHGVIPHGVTFEFDETDIQAEETVAKVTKLRAEAREIMVRSGEIDDEAARQLAVDAGDIPQELLDAMGQRDITGPPARRGHDRTRPESEGRTTPRESDEVVEEGGEKERDPDRAGPEQERLDLEEDVAVGVGVGLRQMGANVRRRLDDLDLG